MSVQQIRYAAAYTVLCLLKKKTKKKKRIWAREWVLRRCNFGIHETLLSELRIEDPSQLDNFLRMSKDDFEYLLKLVGPSISKRDTKMRCAITASERLCLTLRFLATGKDITSEKNNIIYLICLVKYTCNQGNCCR